MPLRVIYIISFVFIIQFSAIAAPDSLKTYDNTIALRTFERNYQEQYRGAEYQYEKEPQLNAIQQLWMKFIQFLNDLFKKSNNLDKPEWFDTLRNVISVLLILVAVALLVWLIMYKGQRLVGRKSKNTDFDVETLESLEQTNFNNLVQQAVTLGNYPLAIRYYYLWLLKNLNEANKIEYHVDKTNADYINELRKTPIAADFQYASYLYNYSWYGKFNINQYDFSRAKQVFQKLIQN